MDEVLLPVNVIRPVHEPTVNILEAMADDWWAKLSWEQKIAAYSNASKVEGMPKAND